MANMATMMERQAGEGREVARRDHSTWIIDLYDDDTVIEYRCAKKHSSRYISSGVSFMLAEVL